MTETYNKPVSLDKIDFTIWGTGNPGWGDPREGFCRMFSKHIVWLCHKKPMSASEIAKELNVPTVYVEEELELLTQGENGEYGLLRKLDNGKYAINFILFDKDVLEQANAAYMEYLPEIGNIISDFIEKNRDTYLSFPYLNRKVDMNLILWQQISFMSHTFLKNIEQVLNEKYFANVKKVDRPFSVFGWISNGKNYGGGWDGVGANNICGYTWVHMNNIYISRIQKHFSCQHNIANDPQLQLAIRAIEGLNISTLPETEKEHAAKAIECGYLYREGDMLYTKILVSTKQDRESLFATTDKLRTDYFAEEAEKIAEKIGTLIQKYVPDYLINEWVLANSIAGMPILDALVEILIEKGLLVPPENGIGAEGCWMIIEK